MSEGIFGIVDFSKHIERPVEIIDILGAFLRIEQATEHSISSKADSHYILGMKRLDRGLSYQQTEIAHNSDSHVLCAMHGDFFNFHDLTQQFSPNDAPCCGDLDLLLNLYRQRGPVFARNLNGLFTLAFVDKRDSSAVLINDRFGLAHQAYWTVKGSSFYFATHLKTLLSFPGIRKEIDPEGLNLFLKYSYITSPWTILKGIRKLTPGSFLIFKDGQVHEETYWDFNIPARSCTDKTEEIATYKALLRKSIARRMEAKGPVGILLSGGLDSSANVAFAAECGQGKPKTFAIGFEEAAFDERPFARIVANHFDTEHFEYTITGEEIHDLPTLIWHTEEPYFEFGLFLTYLGLAAARKEVDVVIGGEGADQLYGTGGFTGGKPVALRYLLQRMRLLSTARAVGKRLNGDYFYNHDNFAFKFRMMVNRVADLNDWYFYGYDTHELSALYKDAGRAPIPEIFPEDQSKNTDSFVELYSRTQRNQDLRHYVNENVMVKSGRMADMLGLQLRESYLDSEVTDFIVSLAYPLRRSGNLYDHLKSNVKTKYLHRLAMTDVLPSEILTKPKQGGFVPVMIFLKDRKLRQDIYNYLLRSKVMREYFRTDYLKRLFDGYEHMQGNKMYWPNFHNSKANRILFLLTFDIWHHYYLQNDPLRTELISLKEYLTG